MSALNKHFSDKRIYQLNEAPFWVHIALASGRICAAQWPLDGAKCIGRVIQVYRLYLA